MKISQLAFMAVFMAVFTAGGGALPYFDQSDPPDTATKTDEPPFNIPVPTLGGTQLWSDVALTGGAGGGWRIQINALTGHCRLLDGDDTRQAWDASGNTSGDCGAYLDEARTEHNLEFASDHLVILLHGIARPRSSMAEMENTLTQVGYQAASISYASTRLKLDAHADNLIRLLESLGGISKVTFVTHSMGGLVARTTLARDDWPAHIAKGGLVMLAPPSSGALLADRYQRFTPFKLLGGPAGQQLTSDGASLVPLPGVRACVIAGGRGDEEGFNPYLPGDDDGIVRVEEAKLHGVEDFLLVPALHNFIMSEPDAQAAVLRFLGSGRCDGRAEF